MEKRIKGGIKESRRVGGRKGRTQRRGGGREGMKVKWGKTERMR